MFRQVLQPLVRSSRNGVRSYHTPADYKPPTMNDLPVPNGSWKENHDRMQRIYNMQLIGGIGFLIGTIAIGKASGLLYLNWEIPKP